MKTYEPICGTDISTACCAATALAIRECCNVEFDFNGIKLTATTETVPADLAKFYYEESERRRAAYVASPEYKAQQVAAEEAQRVRKSKVEALLATAPEHLTLRDAPGWELSCSQNRDGYGGAVMTYAERWARMMEAGMAKGEKLADIASDYSHLADEEGITGFQYGCAVSILSQVWIHGEELRRWHNSETQIGTEGDKANESGAVLNPAVLSVG